MRLARLQDWRVFHARTSRTASGGHATAVAGDGVGFPDLVLVKIGVGVLYRELKTDTGRLRDEQSAWGYALREAGADWAVWRPADWPEITETLARRT